MPVQHRFTFVDELLLAGAVPAPELMIEAFTAFAIGTIETIGTIGRPGPKRQEPSSAHVGSGVFTGHSMRVGRPCSCQR